MYEAVVQWEHPAGHSCSRLVVTNENFYHILKDKSDRARKQERKLQFHYQDDNQYGYTLPEGAICWIPMSWRQWMRIQKWLKRSGQMLHKGI